MKRDKDQLRRDVWDIYYKSMELSGCLERNGTIRREWKGKPELMMQAMMVEAIYNLTEHVDRANRK